MTLEKSLNRVHSKIYYHNRIGKESVKINLYKIINKTYQCNLSISQHVKLK